jgi:phosphoribosylformimino-5-aminoimidazole carboxamide ribotide isomerase
MTGPDVPALRRLLAAAPVPVIASGGVGSVEHLRLLEATGVEAVIVGRALYEGAIPATAIRTYNAQPAG